MNYISLFVGWFLENFTSEDVSMMQLIMTLGLSCINAVYIFFLYRMLSRKTLYSKRYNITVASVAVVTAAIIFTVQSSVVISLGVVGALSIVRFRTAIKDALDIVFLFWAVAVGVCCGAHMSEIAIILSAVLTLLILGLDGISVKRGYHLLIVETEQAEDEEMVLGKLKECCSYYKVNVRNVHESGCKFVIEVKVKREFQMIQDLKRVMGVRTISLVAHEGETVY